MYVPQSLEEFVGQEDAVRQIRQVIEAAKLRGRPLPHILLTGPRGTGKTTLAKLVSKAMKQTLVLTAPSALQSNDELFQLFAANLDNDRVVIFFIDEVHRLGIKIEEDLYLPMENNTFIRKGAYGGGYTMSDFTVIAATTLPGKISEPLRDRFGLSIHMAKYDLHDMLTILKQAATKNSVHASEDALLEIARRSRNNPRTANHLLDRCWDYALVAGVEVDAKSALAAFEVMGIDSIGLNNVDREYLLHLYLSNRPIGVQSLTPILDLDKETIQGVIEPYLIEIGFLDLTPRGRLLTKKGMKYAEKLDAGKDKAMKMIGG